MVDVFLEELDLGELGFAVTAAATGLTPHRHWDRASCQACPLKPQCTPSVERRVTRWEHEATIEAMQRRMDAYEAGLR